MERGMVGETSDTRKILFAAPDQMILTVNITINYRKSILLIASIAAAADL